VAKGPLVPAAARYRYYLTRYRTSDRLGLTPFFHNGGYRFVRSAKLNAQFFKSQNGMNSLSADS
jgi:hypothetical protein